MTRPTSDWDRLRAKARSRALAVLAQRHEVEYRHLYRWWIDRLLSERPDIAVNTIPKHVTHAGRVQ